MPVFRSGNARGFRAKAQSSMTEHANPGMRIRKFESFGQLRFEGQLAGLTQFVTDHPRGGYFQSARFFELIDDVGEYQPLLISAESEEGELLGSLFGVFQSNGGGVKSWCSRRYISWGGPLVWGEQPDATARLLLEELRKTLPGKAIFAEFRNTFDMSDLKSVFEDAGFTYHDHLNHLVIIDEEAAVRRRMSRSRWRQIKSSFKSGAEIAEAGNENEVLAFYGILQTLYRDKVKKPLPEPELFLQFFRRKAGKIFLVKRDGEVLGGIMCPIHDDRIIYEWYVCGRDGEEKGLYPSVLATWAPIAYALECGLSCFDFMGAGRPDEDYGVREFKARFGGEEQCFGRFHMVVNKPLFEIGKLGLKFYENVS